MSDKFTGTERALASFLSRFPGLKRWVKKTYQRVLFWTYRDKLPFECIYPLEKIASGNGESFFGYYDKSPVNKSGEYSVFHHSEFPTNTLPNSDQQLNIMLLKSGSDEPHHIGQTNAWNWQQGSRLQWIDSDRIIFNDFDRDKNKYISNIYNVNQLSTEKIIDFPVYDVYDDFTISLNFDRLGILSPDYGYFASSIRRYHELPSLSEDGIYKVDIKNNQIVLVLNFEEIIKTHEIRFPPDTQHLVNHIMISPDGKLFMFIHRWFIKGIKHHALFVANSDGSGLRCIIEDQMVSHCTWNGSEQIIGYFEHQNNYGYFNISLKSGKISPVSGVKSDNIGDGHPSVSKKRMIYDTYPDKRRKQEIFLLDMENHRSKKIGEFLAPMKYYESTRCDLHPCWNHQGNQIYINSAHEGKRFLYRINLTQNG
jgi:hypothetical protein